MVPNKVKELGQELGLSHVTLEMMSQASIHIDMAYAWLMKCDDVKKKSGTPTMRALAKALEEIGFQDPIDKIIQS